MFLVGIVISMCGCSPCGNGLVSTLLSPDGRLKVIVFTRDCGATVRTDTGVSVLPASASLPGGGANALVVRDNPDRPIERTFPAIDLRLNWISSRRLRVLYPRDAMVDKRATSIGGVAIEYGAY
jgi:hypothetical protein